MPTNVIPADTRLAAKRGFVRTTYQAYAATLTSGISASAVLSVIEGGIDLVTVGVTLGVAVLSPPIAGLASYLSISAKGIPVDYQTDGDPGVGSGSGR